MLLKQVTIKQEGDKALPAEKVCLTIVHGMACKLADKTVNGLFSLVVMTEDQDFSAVGLPDKY